ncbi:MAG: SgcJ/EcaC family oxidoreductase [Sphingomicrobium sp.]
MSGWRSDIEQLIERENGAWNALDAAAFSAAVADDCVFTNIFGQVFSGKEAFEQQHARIFAGVYKGSVLQQSIDYLRLVQPDVAIVDTSVTLSAPAGDFGPARTLHTKLAQVFVRRDGKWRIVSYHNVEERPLPVR